MRAPGRGKRKTGHASAWSLVFNKTFNTSIQTFNRIGEISMDEKKAVRDISVSPVLALSLLVCALGTVAVTIGAAMVWGAGAAFVAFGALVFLWGAVLIV